MTILVINRNLFSMMVCLVMEYIEKLVINVKRKKGTCMKVDKKDARIMELEVILDDVKIFLKTIGTLKPLIVDNCKKLIKKIENAGI